MEVCWLAVEDDMVVEIHERSDNTPQSVRADYSQKCEGYSLARNDPHSPKLLPYKRFSVMHFVVCALV